MSDLRVICRRCAKESPSDACDATGLCALCLVGDLVEPLKTEYRRLWAKRLRYSHRRSIGLTAVEKQLARVARRLGDQVHAHIANPQLAIATINAHLEEVRNEIERPNARIHLPRPGDLTRRLQTA